MSAMNSLSRYFLTGTGEGDRYFIDRAFVSHEQLAEILSVEPGGMRILVGNKGTGKTAIFEWLRKVCSRFHLPVMLIRPDDLDTSWIGQGGDIAGLKRGFYESLASAIAARIGAELKGLLVGNDARLYEAAVTQGTKDADFVRKILYCLSAISKPVTRIDAVRLARELAGARGTNSLISAINSHLLSRGTLFFLLIDDTDQVASPTDPAHLNRIWALLLAIRRITGECEALRGIVSLRSEVWIRLVSESKGQRDQTDHLRGLIVSLRASDRLMKSIVLRRLTLAAEEIGKSRVDPYTVFFHHSDEVLAEGDGTPAWETIILSRSRERPRDAIQLVSRMAARAKANGRSIIGDVEYTEAISIYAHERVDDVSSEFAQDCRELRQVIATFSKFCGPDLNLSFEELRAHMRAISSQFQVKVRGSSLRANHDDDALRLLALLHEADFLNPHIPHPNGSTRRVTFLDEPHFVRKENWNAMQTALWRIHPAFIGRA